MSGSDVGREPNNFSAQDYGNIVDQILNLRGSLTNNISCILNLAAQRDAASVLMGLRWYFRANGKPATDLCYMVIADQFVEKAFKPGDFVLFTYVQKLRQGDIAMVLSKDNDSLTGTLFRKVSDIVADNKVQIESDSGIGRIISRDEIVAKVAKVIPFASKEWNEIATEVAYKVQLQQMLIDVRKDEALEEGMKREIDKRLAYLNK